MQHLCNGQGGVSLYLCIVKMRQVAGALVLHNKARVARHTHSIDQHKNAKELRHTTKLYTTV